MKLCLGKKPAFHDPKALLLANYLKLSALPPLPTSWNWGAAKVTNWPMMLNDQLGDCTCAAAGHLIQEWTTDAGNPIVPTDNQILKAYEAVGGYVPGQPNTDNGAVEADVLKYWQTTGIAGHKISAYVSLEPGNRTHVEASTFLFGGVYIGVALPASAQNQVAPHGTWSVPPGGPVGNNAPGTWGGHAVPIIGYTPGSVQIITWGMVMNMTWSFVAAYMEEAYALLSQDWIKTNKFAPVGFDFAQLDADLSSVKN